MNDDHDDHDLLQRIQGGDGESFGVLYDRTRGWLLSCVILPRVGRHAAEDVLSETFRTALAKIGTFEWRGTGLLHWLAAIARKKALERRRSDLRGSAREEPMPLLFDPSDSVPTAEAEMIRTEALAELSGRVSTTLEAIPERYAEALRSRLLEGRGREECAERLGVSAPTFDVVLYRASRAFAKRWKES